MTSPDRILSEFVDAWNAGRRPRVADYLQQAPERERDELAGLIVAFLENAATPDYSPETLKEIRQEPAVAELANVYNSESGLWPTLLPRLRRRAKLTRDQVVAGIASALGLQGREEKVKLYYHQMESGTIDPGGVSRKVLEAVSGVFGVSLAEIEQAGDFGPPASAAGGLHLRVADDHHLDVVSDMDRADYAAHPASPGGREEMDEVDRLFLGGR